MIVFLRLRLVEYFRNPVIFPALAKRAKHSVWAHIACSGKGVSWCCDLPITIVFPKINKVIGNIGVLYYINNIDVDTLID